MGAMAVLAVLTLTGCGQLGQTHPRLQSIAAAEDEPAPTPSPTPTPEPTVEPPPAPSKPIVIGPPPCPSGPYQLEVETALAKTGSFGHVTVDGKQSGEDCVAITAFQKRMGIVPANGTPGPTTKDVSMRIAATDPTQCPYSEAAIACVDLTHQTFYIAKAGQVIVGPTVTRTGMRGWTTPSGTFRIANKTSREWSVPFSVWMPYWQRFYIGDGLHETTTYIHNMSIGSHGCVNLLHADAVAAYSLLGVGSTVHLYGRRPGT
jgi:lipoprotein-anchoring transpeptidase ErfK/SrfK